MLTPDRIKEKVFPTTGRGSYRSEDVDMFMSEVAASYEQMFKENGDLVRKISILAKKVEEYRADEESLKMALLNAQKLADTMAQMAEGIDGINIAVDESAQGVTSAAQSTGALVEALITIKTEADANREISEDLQGEVRRFKSI